MVPAPPELWIRSVGIGRIRNQSFEKKTKNIIWFQIRPFRKTGPGPDLKIYSTNSCFSLKTMLKYIDVLTLFELFRLLLYVKNAKEKIYWLHNFLSGSDQKMDFYRIRNPGKHIYFVSSTEWSFSFAWADNRLEFNEF